jgi:hypothetical protein
VGGGKKLEQESEIVTNSRSFILRRIEDESDVSGTGDVAEGVEFSNGKCVLCWITQYRSVAVYDSIRELESIHGHDGKTIVVWLSEA